ncbi:Adenylate cyclase [Vibrio aestuarianus]|nr:Adenylate cyclase [Vibrio aestuarianus]
MIKLQTPKLPPTLHNNQVGLKRRSSHDCLPFQVKSIKNRRPSVVLGPKVPKQALSELPHKVKAQDITKSSALAQLVDKIADKTGIVKTHLLPILQVAKKSNQIISFRPVDPMSTGLIGEGYPTKGFAIKGKSSNHGPQAGFICVDQNLSKLHVTLKNDKANRQNQVTKYNASVHECLEKGDAVAVNLTLSQSRIDWLKNSQTIKVEGNNNTLKIFSEGLEYKAEKNGDKFEISHKGQPLKVLADPKTQQPLTADYDLMFIAPKTEHLDLANYDKLPVNRVHFSVLSETYKMRFREKEGEDFTPQLFYAKEEQTKGSSGQAIGNATPRITKAIDELNTETVGENGNPVVHHNADSGSPATDTASNYPITVFMPENLAGYDAIHIIENADQFAEFVKKAKTHGFYVPTNPKWERSVLQARSLNFEQSALIMRNFLQTRSHSV